MENAANALIIAGVIIVAMAILTVGVYLRNNFSDTAEQYVRTMDVTELQKYNTNFEVYADIEKKISAQDIVSLIGVAKKANQGTKVYVKFKKTTSYSGSSYIERTTYSDYTTEPFDENLFLSNHIMYEKNETKYNVFEFDNTTSHGIIYDDYGKVQEIYFMEK